jgi:hypothetical protein
VDHRVATNSFCDIGRADAIRASVVNYVLGSNELEMLLSYERHAWQTLESELDHASVRCLIGMGLLVQNGPYAHITRLGIDVANAVRDGY